MRAAAVAASIRRTWETVSASISALPQSPGVMVQIVRETSVRASSASVPPARISTSSGWAWIARIRIGFGWNSHSRTRISGLRLIRWKFMPLKSYTITQGRDRAPARSMLKAIGFTDEDLRKPIIGIANTWIETMPCNYNLRELAVKVKEGVRAAGGTPMEFNTIAISDGVTMGT